MRLATNVFCALLLLGLLPVAAGAQVPDPLNCQVRLQFNDVFTITEPVALVLVPDNGPAPQPRAELEVLLRDAAGMPVPDAYVFVVFSQAATQTLCWCAEQNQTTWVMPDGRRVFEARTDALGFVEFQMSAGGCVEDLPAATLLASNFPDPQQAVQIRVYRPVADFDNTGAGPLPCDRFVDLRDLQEYAAAHVGGPGAYSFCHDYNADAVINLTDLQLFAQHYLRAARCSAP